MFICREHGRYFRVILWWYEGILQSNFNVLVEVKKCEVLQVVVLLKYCPSMSHLYKIWLLSLFEVLLYLEFRLPKEKRLQRISRNLRIFQSTKIDLWNLGKPDFYRFDQCGFPALLNSADAGAWTTGYCDWKRLHDIHWRDFNCCAPGDGQKTIQWWVEMRIGGKRTSTWLREEGVENLRPRTVVYKTPNIFRRRIITGEK